MIEGLPIALTQVKTFNTSGNLLDEIRQMIYSLYRAIKQNGYYVMNFKNSETSDSHRLFLNLTGKINLKRSDKYVTLSSLSICCTWKNMKKSYKINKFKISALTWDKDFELTDESYYVSDSVSRLVSVYLEKKRQGEKTENPSIRI